MDRPIRLRDGIDSNKSLHHWLSAQAFPLVTLSSPGCESGLTRAQRERIYALRVSHTKPPFDVKPQSEADGDLSSRLHPDRDIPGPSLNRVLGIR